MTIRTGFLKKMDDIIRDMKLSVDKRLDSFFKKAAVELKVGEDALRSIWSGGSGSSGVVVSSSTSTIQPVVAAAKTLQAAKKSPYQIFFSIRRLDLKKKNPDLQFGELSTQISKEWKSMDKAKQASWIESNGAATDDKALSDEYLNGLKMQELRDLCEARNLKKTGNKQELINNLKMSIVDEPVKKARLVSGKTALALHDESVHVTTDNNVIEKRTAIEEIEDSKSGDEDDFDFEDEDDDDDETSIGYDNEGDEEI